MYINRNSTTCNITFTWKSVETVQAYVLPYISVRPTSVLSITYNTVSYLGVVEDECLQICAVFRLCFCLVSIGDKPICTVKTGWRKMWSKFFGSLFLTRCLTKWGVGGCLTTFQLSFLTSKMTKSRVVGEGLVWLIYFPTFLPKLKNDKIPNSLCPGGFTYFSTFIPQFQNDKILNSLGQWRKGEGVVVNFPQQLLFQSSKITKFQIPFVWWGVVDLLSIFCSQAQKWQNPKFPLPRMLYLLSNFCFSVPKWQNSTVPYLRTRGDLVTLLTTAQTAGNRLVHCRVTLFALM